MLDATRNHVKQCHHTSADKASKGILQIGLGHDPQITLLVYHKILAFWPGQMHSV